MTDTSEKSSSEINQQNSDIPAEIEPKHDSSRWIDPDVFETIVIARFQQNLIHFASRINFGVSGISPNNGRIRQC